MDVTPTMDATQAAVAGGAAAYGWPLVAWAGAMAAAAFAFVRHALELRRVGEEVATLRERGAPPPVGRAVPQEPGGRAGTMFRNLYEERASPWDGVRALPGIAPVAVALALAIAAGGMTLHATSDARTAQLAAVRSASDAAAARDSLARVVAALRDSLRAAAAAPLAPATRPAAKPVHRPAAPQVASRTRRPPAAGVRPGAADAALPPPPAEAIPPAPVASPIETGRP
jgi:hypothetical protein